VGAGSSAIRVANCGCSAWIMVNWAVAPVEMGVPLAVQFQTVAF